MEERLYLIVHPDGILNGHSQLLIYGSFSARELEDVPCQKWYKYSDRGSDPGSMVSENVRLSGQRKCHLYCSR